MKNCIRMCSVHFSGWILEIQFCKNCASCADNHDAMWRQRQHDRGNSNPKVYSVPLIHSNTSTEKDSDNVFQTARTKQNKNKLDQIPQDESNI